MKEQISSPIIQEWLERLQESGYRITDSRRAVVETLAENPYALDPTQIFIAARKISPRLGLVTVYRTVEKLEELGLLQRVHQPGGCHAYIAAARGHQHLLICRRCNRTEYFSGDDLDVLISAVGKDRGFIIQDHWLQFYGLCAQCQDAGGQS